MDTCINYVGLFATKHAVKQQYAAADPYPWCLLDDFLMPHVCEEIADGFDETILERAKRHPGEPRKHVDVKRKIASNNIEIMTPAQQRFFEATMSDQFIKYLQEITGVYGLCPDKELFGSGLHQIYPGGFLNLHADFNFHPRSGLLRRLNLILYLNSEWQDSWSGHLELWPEKLDGEPIRIAPTINRAVLFETSETSWHGHPEPLACPEGMTRKSLALYYYSKWPRGLERRSKTTYVLTPKQQADLDGKLAALLQEIDDEKEACARLSTYRPTHVKLAYQRLKTGTTA